LGYNGFRARFLRITNRYNSGMAIPGCEIPRTDGASRGCAHAFRFVMVLLAMAAAAAGCHHAPALDMLPLVNAGMNYDTVNHLKAMNITQPEVTQVAESYEAGLSGAGCVQLFSQYRARHAPFDAGATVAGLLRAGMSEATVMELSNLNELGRDAGELQAMRLAGLSDQIVLEVAQRRADRKPVLSGASLAKLKNTGLRAATLLELARRGVPDSDAKAIIAYRRRGASDTAVLKHFSGA